MFKAQVVRRSFSLWNRAPTSQIIRSAARDGHETIHIQRVRFKKPVFSRSRLLATAIMSTSAYVFLDWLDDIDDEEEEGKGHTTPRLRGQTNKDGITSDEEDTHDEEDEDDALLFFPTGFSRAKPQTFYKGSDPEWQEFKRIAPDKERTNRIRMELVSMIRKMCANNEPYKQRLGHIKPNAGNVWVEIRFPDGPPIEFERPGIEVTEDLTVRWSTRPVNELHHQRLSNILLPTAVASSLYADTKQKAAKGWDGFRSYIGWEDKSKAKKKALAQILAPPPFPPNPRSTSPSTTSLPSSVPSSATSADEQQPTTQSGSTSPQRDPSASSLGNAAFERFLPALPPPTNMTLDLSRFHQTFRKEFKRYRIQPPRGTFIVSGLIEIIGDRARMTLDVKGFYDPQSGKYVMLNIGLRSVRDYRQHPKGGH